VGGDTSTMLMIGSGVNNQRKKDESSGISEKNLPQLQDHTAQRCRAGHL
jgi:hypothetical protein